MKYLISSFLIVSFLFFDGTPCFSQSLKGRLIAYDTHKAISSANIFLSGTSVGTLTNEQGEFLLSNFPKGKYDLVISFTGYETLVVNIQSGALPEFLNLALKPKITELQEVVLESFAENGWKKWGVLFLENFIGTSKFSKECKLLNKEVLRFRYNKKTKILTIRATDRLTIENRALGYILRYDLVRFKYNSNTQLLEYEGYPLFENLAAKDVTEKNRWQANRLQAYQGSIMHFMRSLYGNKLLEEDFIVYRLIKLTAAEKKRVMNILQDNAMRQTASSALGRDVLSHETGLSEDTLAYYRTVRSSPDSLNLLINKPLTAANLASPIDSVTLGFSFGNYLRVINLRKKMPAEYYVFMHTAELDEPITSEINIVHDTQIKVWPNGSFHPAIHLMTAGYWGWSEKVAQLLPTDYWPEASDPGRD